MKSEINSNLYLVLEWPCESKGWMPTSIALQPVASGILWATAFLWPHIPSLCWIMGTVVGVVCLHEEGTWRSVLVEMDFLIANIKKKGAMD